ncbi:MAG: tryptophan synthase subunit alpha [Fibrobacterales bacterium]
MSLSKVIQDAAAEKGIALMTHIICGYPSFDDNRIILDEMEKAGVEVVEMQFPFSEPIADGPVFAQANQVSIENGTTIDQCFAFVKECSEKYSFQILMMGYYNTVFKRGEEKFCKDLVAAGGVGMIVPDVPLEEATDLRKYAKESKLSLVQLVAPTNTEERIAHICTLANELNSIVYAVARKGVTGKKTELDRGLEGYLSTIKRTLNEPLAVGFGIKSKADVDYLRGKAECAVIGTAMLTAYESGGAEGVRSLLTELRP